MDIEKYLQECFKMEMLKRQDEDIRKVYADVNFNRLIARGEKHLAIQRDMELADSLFPKNVTQNDCAAAPDPAHPD